MPSDERLQKVLAKAGVASRRHAEELITAGRVRVNGRLVTALGTRVDPVKDKVEVDGRRVLAEPKVYYMFHKPRGCVTTLTDPEGRATIKDYLKELANRVFPVGRLDFHTSGAMLLTNDGDLAQALLHPRRAVAKTYVAKLRGVPTDLQLDRWREGMDLEPVEGEYGPVVRTQPVEVDVLRHAPSGIGATNESGTTWVKVTLREGRNRQIHRMAEATSLFVMRLARLSFAGLTTDGLRPGELRTLTEKELNLLRTTYQRAAEAAPRAAAGKGAALPPADARAAGPVERGPKVPRTKGYPPRAPGDRGGPAPRVTREGARTTSATAPAGRRAPASSDRRAGPAVRGGRTPPRR